MSNRAKKLEEELQLRLLEVKEDPTAKRVLKSNWPLADMLISDSEAPLPADVACAGTARLH